MNIFICMNTKPRGLNHLNIVLEISINEKENFHRFRILLKMSSNKKDLNNEYVRIYCCLILFQSH